MISQVTACSVGLGSETIRKALTKDEILKYQNAGFSVEELTDQHQISTLVIQRVYEITTHRLVLKASEQVLNLLVSPETVSVSIRVYQRKETAYGYQPHKSGTRLYQFELTSSGWSGSKPFTIWDAECNDPSFERTRGMGPDLATWTARREHEALAYRVGTHRTPLDNAQRVTEGYVSEKMIKHWE